MAMTPERIQTFRSYEYLSKQDTEELISEIEKLQASRTDSEISQNCQDEPTIVRSWDSLPPIVYDGNESFSTRLLCDQYRKLEQEIERLQKLEPLAELGKEALETILECLTDGGCEVDMEPLADKAVDCGLMQYVPYDPAIHGELENCDPEPGEMIYWYDGGNNQ